MIFLDTNYLIRGLIKGTEESGHLLRWSETGTELITNSLVWCEFITGPITQVEIDLGWNIVGKAIQPFDHTDAVLAAKLFNELGRPRSRRADIMIAASAINRQASLATANTSDFAPLCDYGLSLVNASS